MSRYSILTESGSLYTLDTAKQTLHRLPAEDGEKLHGDDEAIKYDTLLSELTIDTPLRVLWTLDGNQKLRTTTPMVEIVRT